MLYPNLFTPITLNKLVLPNRIYSTAHAEVYAEAGGMPGERYIKYYEEKAKGGLGMAICGGSSPVSIDVPQGAWRPVNLTTDRVIEPLSRLAEAMHRHGSRIMIQATHMGRRSAFAGDPWPHLVSPSGVREMMHRGNAKIIEIEEMRRIVKDFAAAAKRVQDAGMDGIEISAAHQHLIDQFWSPRTNQRTDEYGGSLANRMRFGMEVLHAVREAVGADFCVGMRMCADEFHDDGLDPETLKEIAQTISETGLIDFISVIGSGADTHNTVTNCMPSMALPPEPFVNLAAGIKAVSAVPILHAQGIRDVTQAERIITNGLVDMVGMTRAHIADPHIIRKIREGKDDQIKQCVGANYCIDRQYSGQDVLCIQNAATSREATMPHIIKKNTLMKRKYECKQPVSLAPALKLHNQPAIGTEWLFMGTGIGASNQFEAGGFIYTDNSIGWPNIQYHFLPVAINYNGSKPIKIHSFQAHMGSMRSESRGRVQLRSKDPHEYPSILFNYMSKEQDWAEFRAGVRITRSIMQQTALAPYLGREISPGKDIQTDAEIDAFVREHAETAYHPCGTCAMGYDDFSVVDKEGRIHGLEGLRVVDASIMPRIITGNLNAPTIMMAEKIADCIRVRQALPALNVLVYKHPNYSNL